MAVHLVVRQNGQHARVQIAPDNALAHGVDAGEVIFAVRSAQPERSEVIAGAVSAIFNHWCIPGGPNALPDPTGITRIRDFHDDTPDFEHYTEHGTYYVYAYAHRPQEDGWQGGWDRNHVFYVGMGCNDRYLQHLNSRTLAGANEPRKIQRIQRALGHPPWNTRAPEIVRHLAAFVGPLAGQCAAVVERFLITYHFGVYRLTNRTGGNGRHAAHSDRWIVLPNGITVFDEWHELLQILMAGEDPATSQTLRRGMTARSVSAQVHWNIGDIADGCRRLIRANPEGDLFASDGTDVTAEHLLLYDNRSVMRLQFRMSETDAAFRINLRPLRGKHTDFPSLIAAMFFDGDSDIAAGRIRNRGPNCFFKPCAAGGNGRHDINFDCADLDLMYTLKDVPHFGMPLPWRATLQEVLLGIVSRIPEPT